MSEIKRVPKGVPTGGQFAEGRKSEAGAALLDESVETDNRPEIIDFPEPSRLRDGESTVVEDDYPLDVTRCGDHLEVSRQVVADFTTARLGNRFDKLGPAAREGYLDAHADEISDYYNDHAPGTLVSAQSSWAGATITTHSEPLPVDADDDEVRRSVATSDPDGLAPGIALGAYLDRRDAAEKTRNRLEADTVFASSPSQATQRADTTLRHLRAEKGYTWTDGQIASTARAAVQAQKALDAEAQAIEHANGTAKDAVFHDALRESADMLAQEAYGDHVTIADAPVDPHALAAYTHRISVRLDEKFDRSLSELFADQDRSTVQAHADRG